MINFPWSKRRWAQLICLVLAIVLVPYLFSRLAGEQRRISVFESGSTDAADQNSLKRPLRIACYNIAHGRGLTKSNWQGGDRKTRLARLDEIASLLQEVNADVVVLNEVDFDSSWSHSVNQAEYLAAKAGYRYRVEQRNLDFRVLGWTWRFGNAVLSRNPITSADVIDLPCYSAWEELLAGKKRGVACDITAGETPIRILGVHLSHRSEDLRNRSAEVIGERVQRDSIPTFVAGDMNSSPSSFPGSNRTSTGDNAIETFDLTGEWKRAPTDTPVERSRLTFPADQPRIVIDWILVPVDWQIENYQAVDSQLSDHRPVYADVSR